MTGRHTAPTSSPDDRHLQHLIRHAECRWLLHGHRQVNVLEELAFCPIERALRWRCWDFNCWERRLYVSDRGLGFSPTMVDYVYL
jgi:hypothetical protein